MLPFIETRSGVDFWPLEPRAKDINIRDIAHALSNQCRFSGHTREHYSVAEHCVRVSELLEAWDCTREVQLWGLLHDASEAYLVDLPSPLKCDPRFAFYKTAEQRVMYEVCRAFGLPFTEPDVVRAADSVLLFTEARDLMTSRGEMLQHAVRHEPLPETIVPWTSYAARRCFVARFEALTRSDTTPSPPRTSDGAPTLIPNGAET